MRAMPRPSMTIRCGLSRVLGSVRHPAARASAVIGSCTMKIIRQPAKASRPAVSTGPPKPSTPHTIELAANARGAKSIRVRQADGGQRDRDHQPATDALQRAGGHQHRHVRRRRRSGAREQEPQTGDTKRPAHADGVDDRTGGDAGDGGRRQERGDHPGEQRDITEIVGDRRERGDQCQPVVRGDGDDGQVGERDRQVVAADQIPPSAPRSSTETTRARYSSTAMPWPPTSSSSG